MTGKISPENRANIALAVSIAGLLRRGQPRWRGNVALAVSMAALLISAYGAFLK